MCDPNVEIEQGGRPLNQEEKVLAWLKSGKMINKTIALREFGIKNLNTKIFRLRDEGFNIPGPVEICEETGKKMSHYTWGEQRG